MREKVIDLGFEFQGTCHCHGGTSYNYDHPSKPGWRIEIGTNNYWIKQMVGAQYQTVTFGNTQTFREALVTYFEM